MISKELENLDKHHKMHTCAYPLQSTGSRASMAEHGAWAWMNMELLTELKHKEGPRKWKQQQAI